MSTEDTDTANKTETTFNHLSLDTTCYVTLATPKQYLIHEDILMIFVPAQADGKIYKGAMNLDLAGLLAQIRKDNPALYMKGVTQDMLREYT